MKKYISLERNQAAIIQKNYRCSGCWNMVFARHDKDGDYLDCGTGDCKLPGLVHHKWIERRIAHHEQIARMAKEVLRDSFDWIVAINRTIPRSREISLHELGF